MEYSAKTIAQFVQGTIVGDENATVNTFAKIEEGVPGALTFLANAKYTHYIYETKASVVLVNNDLKLEKPVQTTLIKVANAYESLAKLMTMYEQSHPKRVGVHPLAYVAPTAKIGKDVYLAPFACVGDEAEIGDGTELHPHATVGRHAKVGKNSILYTHAVVYHDCRVGDNCILHAGCVIGADGFGFAPTADGYEKIPQIGIAVIEDNVEIGANTCVDRATMGATIVHSGVKLDNLIQVAHNVEVGSHTVMAAQAGIAGSAKIGQWCMLGGQTGISGHIRLADRVTVAAQAGVIGNVKKSATLLGSPAIDAHLSMKAAAYNKRLPDLFAQMKQMEKEIAELRQQIEILK